MKQSERLMPLKGAHLFSRAYRKGRSFSGGCMVLYVIHGRNASASLLGITVSRKRGNAVARNRVKRWIREAYRGFLPVLKKGRIIVIVAKQPAVTAGYAVLRDELEELLGKAALLDAQP